MMPAPIEADEARRLSALHHYDILDTPAEAEFDDFTKLASQICGTPIALISLVGAERQWFKSNVGLDATETARDISFCGHAIHGLDVFEVPNTLDDERFSDNPLVTSDPNIRFYAGAPLVTPDGFGIGTLCVIDRVPHRLSAEQREALAALGRQVVRQFELRRARNFLANVLSAASAVSIIATDSQGLMTVFNLGAQRLLGYSAGDVVGKQTPALFHKADEVVARGQELSSELGRPVEGFRVFVEMAELRGSEQREWTYIHKDGHAIAVSLVVTTMRGDSGEVLGYLGIAQDISERKRMEQMKSEFVSTVSHELRTPLTSIAGALDLLIGGAMGELPAAVKSLLEIANKNSLRLTHLINDLLDMDKIAAGKMVFDMQVQALMPLVEQSLQANKAYGEAHRVRFALVQRLDGVQVSVDSQRLQQILANFLSNAAKFSPEGDRVEVTVERLGQRVRVALRDHGPGIPDEFRSRIFQRFAQADSSDTRQKGGTGLGLAITKELADRMGGTVGFESVVGQGANFWVEFPICNEAPGTCITTTEEPSKWVH